MARPAQFGLEDLIGAGLELVSERGFDSVSVRSVASAVGISPMALYRLIADADHLRRLLADAPASRLYPAGSGPLDTTMRVWAHQAYAALSAYSGMAVYVLSHWTDLPGWLGIVDALLARAATEGIEGAPAVARVNAVFAFVLSRAQLRDTIGSSSTRSLPLLDSTPDRYRFIRANRDHFLIAETDRHFAFGLAALLAGLDAIGSTEAIPGPGRRHR